jgi:hypothetical protein
MNMETLGEAGMRRAIVQRLMMLQTGSQRRWGKMTPHQAICHLCDSFLGCMGLKPVSPARRLPFQGQMMKFFALYVPLRWPKGIKTRPEMEQGIGGTPPSEFERDRNDLLAVMDRFVSGTERAPHPIFGQMNESEWLRWGYLHMDHHLRQFGV